MIKSSMIPGIAALAIIVSVIWLLTLAWSDPLVVIKSAAADDKASYALSIRSECHDGSHPVRAVCLHHVGKPNNHTRPTYVIGPLKTGVP